EVLSEGQMAPVPGIGLDDLLKTDPDSQDDHLAAFPRIMVLQPPAIDPFAPADGQQVTVAWSESNDGADSGGHLSTVGWWLSDHWADPIQEVICDPMTHGQTVQHSITMNGVAAGDWMIVVTANADGAQDTTAPPTATGFGTMVSTPVRVGGGNASDRPASPGDANWTGYGDALRFLSQAYSAEGNDNALSAAAQALYSFAGSLDSGGVADPETRKPGDAGSIACVQRAQALEAKVGTIEWDREVTTAYQTELGAAIEALSAITDPSEGGAAAVAAMLGIGLDSLGLR
ncbi:MAG TPA: hypothetical protein VF954_05015, partial [Acidimicrobiales bacterium]